jgi:hypothetical protein
MLWRKEKARRANWPIDLGVKRLGRESLGPGKGVEKWPDQRERRMDMY